MGLCAHVGDLTGGPSLASGPAEVRTSRWKSSVLTFPSLSVTLPFNSNNYIQILKIITKTYFFIICSFHLAMLSLTSFHIIGSSQNAFNATSNSAWVLYRGLFNILPFGHFGHFLILGLNLSIHTKCFSRRDPKKENCFKDVFKKYIMPNYPLESLWNTHYYG